MDGDILAFANDFDLALVTVEELKADALIDVLALEDDSLVGKVFNDPLVTTLLFHGLRRRLLAWCGSLSRCWFGGGSGNLLLLLGGGSSYWLALAGALGCKESCGAGRILSAGPVADGLLLGDKEGLESLHHTVVCLEPCLFLILALLADSVSVEENLGLNLSHIVT